MESNCSFISCEKLDRVANWVGSNVASAFFASLERCSCINLSTTDLEDDANEEAHDRPLMFSRPISQPLDLEPVSESKPNPTPTPTPIAASN